MALIKCPECNSEVSEQAKQCPSCGYVLKRKNKMIIVLPTLVIIVVLVLVTIYILNQKNNSNNIESEMNNHSDMKAGENISDSTNALPDTDALKMLMFYETNIGKDIYKIKRELGDPITITDHTDFEEPCTEYEYSYTAYNQTLKLSVYTNIDSPKVIQLTIYMYPKTANEVTNYKNEMAEAVNALYGTATSNESGHLIWELNDKKIAIYCVTTMSPFVAFSYSLTE